MNEKVNELLSSKDKGAIQTIGEHLKKIAITDPEFEKKVLESGKTLDDCFKYITNEARRYVKHNCAMVHDEEVFGWAVHFYDEGGKPEGYKPPVVKQKVEVVRAEKPKEEKKKPMKGKDDDTFYNLFDF